MAGIDQEPAPATVATGPDEPGTTVVNIGGELDIATVPTVERELEQMLVRAPDRLAFNLSSVTFMDSSGIAMLLRVAERVPALEIRAPSSSVRLVIEATGLSEFLNVAL
jgi:anti-anti-sigma factor